MRRLTTTRTSSSLPPIATEFPSRRKWRKVPATRPNPDPVSHVLKSCFTFNKNNIALVAGQDLCPCKEEVEMEEETALAQAIERSFAQQVALPHVPGLTSDEAQVVRIRCQEEVSVFSLLLAFSLIRSIYCKPVKCSATCCQSE